MFVQCAENTKAPMPGMHIDALDPPDLAVSPIAPLESVCRLAYHLAVNHGNEIASPGPFGNEAPHPLRDRCGISSRPSVSRHSAMLKPAIVSTSAESAFLISMIGCAMICICIGEDGNCFFQTSDHATSAGSNGRCMMRRLVEMACGWSSLRRRAWTSDMTSWIALVDDLSVAVDQIVAGVGDGCGEGIGCRFAVHEGIDEARIPDVCQRLEPG
jgi:hypothetical protein